MLLDFQGGNDPFGDMPSFLYTDDGCDLPFWTAINCGGKAILELLLTTLCWDVGSLCSHAGGWFRGGWGELAGRRGKEVWIWDQKMIMIPTVIWDNAYTLSNYRASLQANLPCVAQMVKNLPAVQETRVWSLGWEDLLGKETATHSSILAWRIPWTEESGGLWAMGLQKVRHN